MLALLSTKEITVVFANIEDLLLINTVGLSMDFGTYANRPLELCQLSRRASEGLPIVHRQDWRHSISTFTEHGCLYGLFRSL